MAEARLSEAAPLVATFRHRWHELTGLAFHARRRIPETLIHGLATLVCLQQGGAPAGPCTVFIRDERGDGCAWEAEIAGWYSAPIAPGGACIGQAAVLNALNAAASAICLAHQCPSECPCMYVPQPQIAAYRCTATVEEGFLLQGKRVWNCHCGVVRS